MCTGIGFALPKELFLLEDHRLHLKSFLTPPALCPSLPPAESRQEPQHHPVGSQGGHVRDQALMVT